MVFDRFLSLHLKIKHNDFIFFLMLAKFLMFMIKSQLKKFIKYVMIDF